MDETSTEVVTHTEPQNVRLRTTVVVAAMLILPAAAVLGVKTPGAATSPKRNEALAAARPEPTPAAAPQTAAEPRRQGLFHQTAAAADVVPAGGSLASAEGHDPHVQPASANIDVHGQPVGQLAGGASLGPDSTSDRATSSVSANSGHAGQGGTEQFTQIQQRLRALGATHYALETWGTDGQFYRFQCQMAAGHNAAYTRKFEATDSDALRTMQAVLSDVEAWKSGRMP
ncbi:MAG: hypothetical protein JNK76_07615 [Planctomycetales bacterium]|nr:hypothetical protein [Planctomycetales bacterium]MBN8624696.1 hypothetical protein [Planctomycetota bacterium]